jgi:hypothetical protein
MGVGFSLVVSGFLMGCLPEQQAAPPDLAVKPGNGAACDRVGELAAISGGFCFCGNDHDWHCSDVGPSSSD